MRQAHATDTSSVTSSLNVFSGTDHNFSIASELLLLLLVLTQDLTKLSPFCIIDPLFSVYRVSKDRKKTCSPPTIDHNILLVWIIVDKYGS
jgi:hypothetical protein